MHFSSPDYEVSLSIIEIDFYQISEYWPDRQYAEVNNMFFRNYDEALLLYKELINAYFVDAHNITI